MSSFMKIPKITLTLLSVTLTSSFLFGYLTSSFNHFNAKNQQTISANLTTDKFIMRNQKHWKYCSFLAGAFIGSLLSFISARYFGSKSGLLVNNSFALLYYPFLLTSTYNKAAPQLIHITNFYLGVLFGVANNLTPLYLMEISTKMFKGRFVCLHRIAVLFGSILGILVEMNIRQKTELWPKAGYIIPLIILSLFIYPLIPTSPAFHYYERRDRDYALLIQTTLSKRLVKDTNEAFADLEKEICSVNKSSVSNLRVITRKTSWKYIYFCMWISILNSFAQEPSIARFNDQNNECPIGSDDYLNSFLTIKITIALISSLLSGWFLDQINRKNLIATANVLMLILSFIVMQWDAIFTVYQLDACNLTAIKSIMWFAYITFHSGSFALLQDIVIAELFSHNVRAAAFSIIKALDYSIALTYILCKESIYSIFQMTPALPIYLVNLFSIIFISLNIPEPIGKQI